MRFQKTQFRGLYIIIPEVKKDQRGDFQRHFCQKEFKKRNLQYKVMQTNSSFNSKKGTLRGMHYQTAPFEEAKLVSCLQGKIFDVVIDLRRKSKTFHQYFSITLSAKNKKMLYIPKGFAHGFQTLIDNTIIFYHMFEFFHPRCAAGIHWNDPLFKIEWPIKKKIISKKDKLYKNFK